MNTTKNDLIADLVRYINGLDKSNKTVAYMTALLISWKEMDLEEVCEIVNQTMQAVNRLDIIEKCKDIIH